MIQLYAFIGFIGSGKDTAAQVLVDDHGYTKEAFASPVKDVMSAMFGWDRHLLEGDTNHSRHWRTQVDPWWSKKLDLPYFSPRWAMQHLATDILRDKFHNDIWALSLERRLLFSDSDRVVITDARFRNEIEFIRTLGGKIVQVSRGEHPDWYNSAKKLNEIKYGSSKKYANYSPKKITNTVLELEKELAVSHQSEYDWIGIKPDYTIENNGTINDLRTNVHNMLR